MKSKKKVSKWRKRIQQRKRKNNRRHIMEKPKFGAMFIKRLLAYLCVAVILCLIGTVGVTKYYNDMKVMEFYSLYNYVREQATESYRDASRATDSPEEAFELWKSQMSFLLNTYCATFEGDAAIALYDANTQQQLVENRSAVHVIYRELSDTEEQSGYRYYYECSYELMQEALDAYDKTYVEIVDKDQDGMGDGLPTISLVAKDMYVKNGEFVPGKVVLQQYDNFSDEPSAIIQEFDYTPEDTAGYEHIIIDGNEDIKVLGPMWSNQIENDRIKGYLREYAEKGFSIVDEWEWPDMSDSHSTLWGFRYFDNTLVLSEDIPDDILLELVIGVQSNVFEQYGASFVKAYITVLLLTLALSLATAYRSYMMRCNHYQLDEYRRQTTNAMAHDLKTPLMAISGYADNLRANVHSEKKDYYADVILEHVQYMNQMIGNILELAKVENVRWVPDKEDVDLKSMTEDILKQYEILTADKKITLDVEGESTIQADKSLMTQALRNLISNAMKYAANGTIINIQIDKESFEIRNIMEGELDVSVDELWKPFVKGDNSRSEQKGTGIGLTIVKNITDAHGFELVLRCEEKEFIAQMLY